MVVTFPPSQNQSGDGIGNWPRQDAALPSCRAGFVWSDAVIRCRGAASHALNPALPSKLRGALGEDLKATASAAALTGRACDWHPPCALDVLWRSRGQMRPGYPIPAPWVFAVDAVGDDLVITLRLFGHATDYLGEATEGVIRGLGRGLTGVGPVTVADRRFEVGAGLPTLAATRAVLLRFLTPVLLRHDQAAHSDPGALMRSLVHRVEGVLWWSGQSIAPGIPGLLAAVEGITGIWITPEAERWTRFSSPQEKELTMQGVTGQLMLAGGTLSQLADLLAIGTMVHAGGRTAFGQGRFVVEAAE